ncbi:MAG: hypothetical protein K9K67_08580 [Bacteriovoracaceae bacterium]|nr:hypothetical protein [Bacteriovoracaceae bacterium]
MMKTTFFFITALFCLLSFGSEDYPSWYPQVSCETKWKNLGDDRFYSFEKDAFLTDLGNTGYDSYKERVKREECLKEWTVLVYMAADNDLSPYALWDIHEMESQLKNELNLGSSTDRTDVIVELDTLRDTGVRRLHIFQTEESYRSDLSLNDYEKMDERFVRSPIVKHFPEIGAGRLQSAESRFKRFLSWGVQNYPAKKYMIVMWGHGEGFLGQYYEKSFERKELSALPIVEKKSRFFVAEDFALDSFIDLPQAKAFSLEKQFGGIAFDNSDQSFIDISTLGDILRDWKEKLLEGKNFDFLAFDACLMQSLEVIAEVSQSTDFIAGSNQIQNYLGLPYRKLLDQINMGVGSYELAKSLPVLTRDSWGQEGYQGSVDPKGLKTFTMSTLASSQVENNLYFHFHKVATQLKSYIDEDRSRKQELLFILEQSPRFQGEMIDLGLFYGLLEKLLWKERMAGEETSRSLMLSKTVGEAHFRLRELFIESQFGTLYYDGEESERAGYLLGHFTGMSLWLPKNERLYNMRKNEMAKSSLFLSITSWNVFLEELYKIDLFDFGPL